jgi:hypothetical protein
MDLQPGEVVWVRLHGHPWWPARIMGFQEPGSKDLPLRFLETGENFHLSASSGCIIPFASRPDLEECKWVKSKPNKRKLMQKFMAAVKAAHEPPTAAEAAEMVLAAKKRECVPEVVPVSELEAGEDPPTKRQRSAAKLPASIEGFPEAVTVWNAVCSVAAASGQDVTSSVMGYSIRLKMRAQGNHRDLYIHPPKEYTASIRERGGSFHTIRSMRGLLDFLTLRFMQMQSKHDPVESPPPLPAAAVTSLAAAAAAALAAAAKPATAAKPVTAYEPATVAAEPVTARQNPQKNAAVNATPPVPELTDTAKPAAQATAAATPVQCKSMPGRAIPDAGADAAKGGAQCEGTGDGSVMDGMDGVRSLLATARVEQYAPSFEESGYDDLPFLLSIAHNRSRLDELHRHVGFKPGHAARFEHELVNKVGKRSPA